MSWHKLIVTNVAKSNVPKTQGLGFNDLSEKNLFVPRKANYLTLHCTKNEKDLSVSSRHGRKYTMSVLQLRKGVIVKASNIEQNTERYFNQCFDKGRLKNFILWFLKTYGEKKTIHLVERLKNIGFEYASKAGISLGIDDLKIPPKKYELIFVAEKLTNYTINQYKRGEITGVERFQRLIDTWHRTSENLKQEVINHFEATDVLNPVYMMAFSGARGNISQVRQLVGMRGLMADPQGQILDFPIRSNFKEGLTLTEYIISSYGARKGIVDTALRTANAGYLTRRLVDVAQHVIISNFDCGTRRGIFLKDMKDGNKTIHSLSQRLVGRILARDLILPNSTVSNNKTMPYMSGTADLSKSKDTQISNFNQNKDTVLNDKKKDKKVIAKRNEEITFDLAFSIASKFQKVFVRSPLTCETNQLVCQFCYGWSLAQGSTLVSIGEAVGVIAAQSIGEPGTQLTMRTFHTGGVFSGDISDQIRAPFNGVIEYINAIPGILIRTPEGKIAFLTKGEGSFFVHSFLESDSTSKGRSVKFKIPVSTLLYIRNGQKVTEKEVIAQISTISKKSNATDEAELTIKSEYEGQFYTKSLAFREKFIGPLCPTTDGCRTEDRVEALSNVRSFGNLSGQREKIYEAWTWGYAWILTGKIYTVKYPGTSLFPIFGDSIRPNSQMYAYDWNLNLIQGGSTFKLSFNNSYNYINKWFPQLKKTSSTVNQNSLTILQRKANNTATSGAPIIVEQNLLSISLSKLFFKQLGYVLKLSPKEFIYNTTNLNRPISSISNKELLSDNCSKNFINNKTFENFKKERQVMIKDILFFKLNIFNKNLKNNTHAGKTRSFLKLYWFPNRYQTTMGGLFFFEKLSIPSTPFISKGPFNENVKAILPLVKNTRGTFLKTMKHQLTNVPFPFLSSFDFQQHTASSTVGRQGLSNNQNLEKRNFSFQSISSSIKASFVLRTELNIKTRLTPSKSTIGFSKSTFPSGSVEDVKTASLLNQGNSNSELSKGINTLDITSKFETFYKNVHFGMRWKNAYGLYPRFVGNTQLGTSELNTNFSMLLKNDYNSKKRILWVPIDSLSRGDKNAFPKSPWDSRDFDLFFNKNKISQILTLPGESSLKAKANNTKDDLNVTQKKKTSPIFIQTNSQGLFKPVYSSLDWVNLGLGFTNTDTSNNLFYFKKEVFSTENLFNLYNPPLRVRNKIKLVKPLIQEMTMTEKSKRIYKEKKNNSLIDFNKTQKNSLNIIPRFTNDFSISNKKAENFNNDFQFLSLTTKTFAYRKLLKSLTIKERKTKTDIINWTPKLNNVFVKNVKTDMTPTHTSLASFCKMGLKENYINTTPKKGGHRRKRCSISLLQNKIIPSNFIKKQNQQIHSFIRDKMKFVLYLYSLNINSPLPMSLLTLDNINTSNKFRPSDPTKTSKSQLKTKNLELKKGWVFVVNNGSIVTNGAKGNVLDGNKKTDDKEKQRKTQSLNSLFYYHKKLHNTSAFHNKNTLKPIFDLDFNSNISIYTSLIVINEIFNVRNIKNFKKWVKKPSRFFNSSLETKSLQPINNLRTNNFKNSTAVDNNILLSSSIKVTNYSLALLIQPVVEYTEMSSHEIKNYVYSQQCKQLRGFSYSSNLSKKQINNTVPNKNFKSLCPTDPYIYGIDVTKSHSTPVSYGHGRSIVKNFIETKAEKNSKKINETKPVKPFENYNETMPRTVEGRTLNYDVSSFGPYKKVVKSILLSATKERKKSTFNKIINFSSDSLIKWKNLQGYNAFNKQQITSQPLAKYPSSDPQIRPLICWKNTDTESISSLSEGRKQQKKDRVYSKRNLNPLRRNLKNQLNKKDGLKRVNTSRLNKIFYDRTPVSVGHRRCKNYISDPKIRKENESYFSFISKESINLSPFIVSSRIQPIGTDFYLKNQTYSLFSQPLLKMDEFSMSLNDAFFNRLTLSGSAVNNINLTLSQNLSTLLTLVLRTQKEIFINKNFLTTFKRKQLLSYHVFNFVPHLFESSCLSFNNSFKMESNYFQANTGNNQFQNVEHNSKGKYGVNSNIADNSKQRHLVNQINTQFLYTSKNELGFIHSPFIAKTTHISKVPYKGKGEILMSEGKRSSGCMVLTKDSLCSYYLSNAYSSTPEGRRSVEDTSQKRSDEIIGTTIIESNSLNYKNDLHINKSSNAYSVGCDEVTFLTNSSNTNENLNPNILKKTNSRYSIQNVLVKFLNMTDISISNIKGIETTTEGRQLKNLKNLKRLSEGRKDIKTLKISDLTGGQQNQFSYQNKNSENNSEVSRKLLGEFYVYGDQISETTAIKTSGQLIHYNKNKITLRRAQPIFISPKGILHKFDGDFIDPSTSAPVITLSYQRIKTGDIVQGIPKVEQFFEARKTKRGRFFRDSIPYLLNSIFKRYSMKLPVELAVRQSFYKIQQILVEGVQRVYKSQGVTISDKHLEIIVKQMTSKVRIIDGAQTGFFTGEVVDLYFVEKINQFLIKKITYEPLVLGITKGALAIDSFLSAASFQQTTRVLSQAALYRKKDFLKGLKENVILGNLIPAGTGFLVHINSSVNIEHYNKDRTPLN